jgi:Fic family protein
VLVSTVKLEGAKITWARTAEIYDTMDPLDIVPLEDADHIAFGFKAAMSKAFNVLSAPVSDWTEVSVNSIHAVLCPHLKRAGQYRRASLLYGEDVSPPTYHEAQYLMGAFFPWLQHYHANDMDKLQLAINAYLFLLHIHPWSDCNGRVSRIVMIFLMLHEDFMPPILVLEDDLLI